MACIIFSNTRVLQDIFWLSFFLFLKKTNIWVKWCQLQYFVFGAWNQISLCSFVNKENDIEVLTYGSISKLSLNCENMYWFDHYYTCHSFWWIFISRYPDLYPALYTYILVIKKLTQFLQFRFGMTECFVYVFVLSEKLLLGNTSKIHVWSLRNRFSTSDKRYSWCKLTLYIVRLKCFLQ